MVFATFSDCEGFYSLLDGMLAHYRVTTDFTDFHLYTAFGRRETESKVSCPKMQRNDLSQCLNPDLWFWSPVR